MVVYLGRHRAGLRRLISQLKKKKDQVYSEYREVVLFRLERVRGRPPLSTESEEPFSRYQWKERVKESRKTNKQTKERVFHSFCKKTRNRLSTGSRKKITPEWQPGGVGEGQCVRCFRGGWEGKCILPRRETRPFTLEPWESFFGLHSSQVLPPAKHAFSRAVSGEMVGPPPGGRPRGLSTFG